jgi:hypothetical protein
MPEHFVEMPHRFKQRIHAVSLPDLLAVVVHHRLIESDTALEHVVDRLAADELRLGQREGGDHLHAGEVAFLERRVKRFHNAGGAGDLVLKARTRNLSMSDRLRPETVLPGGGSTLRETRRREPPLLLSTSLPRPLPTLAGAGQ